MKLDGIHHVTAITGDAPTNLDFYTRVLGLRLVKKTVNQDDPGVYHLFYSDEAGSPGADLTFFEYPGAPRGRPGAGMVHRVVYRVGSRAALDFWSARLAKEGISTSGDERHLRFSDPEGLALELAVTETDDEPLIARHPEIPREHALQGFAGVHAYSADPAATARFLDAPLGFARMRDGVYLARGRTRGAFYAFAPSPRSGIPGAGTVHHVAWSSPMEDHPAWRERVAAGGGHPTPVIDRFYFRSIYFREPGGVLFEIATQGPGFATDEPLEHLGERLSLPPKFEPLRAELEKILTPLPDPRL
ncbi:MAG TPA: VOC family protein [bacterium]|nr:VOC family protein [bacterium]